MEPEILSTVTTLIANQLFPIAICLILLWYINGTQEKERATLESLGKVVQENTLVMRELQTIVRERFGGNGKNE